MVRREVAIFHVFSQNLTGLYLFYSGRFDFVVYKRHGNNEQFPLLAIELDGKEHFNDETVIMHDTSCN